MTTDLEKHTSFDIEIKPFRLWLQARYYENRDECERWGTAQTKTFREYVSDNRWWLRQKWRKLHRD